MSMTVPAYVEQRVLLQNELWPTAPLLPGANKLILHLKAHNISIPLATSSRRRVFRLKTGHLGDTFGLFEGKVVCGDDPQYNMGGKPIFLVAARELLGRGVGSADGVNLTTAQLAERRKGSSDFMSVNSSGRRRWVPDTHLLSVKYSGEEKPDQTLKSLEEFVPEQWGLPPYE
ncbi:hypothetical protein DFH07DRAFT_949195 [Mycena maculata]|uniref:Uncharacterized protein n=1 Tax=Mycena maculata TaxID=230809 RepID=A0AAD7KBG2_9AGAR|nr:hypothetical protein DFH07DRAFT_949195 [Mycena maculata]